MSEHQALFNYEVADVYQNMLNGDASALYKLQQINVMNHLSRLRDTSGNHKHKINTEQNSHNLEESQLRTKEQDRDEQQLKTSSVANISSKKEQMYLNVIRRGAKMGALSKNEIVDKSNKPRRLTNSSQREPEKELREVKLKPKFNKEANPQNDLSAEFKSHHTADLQLPKPNKVYALPKVPKAKKVVKIQSAQVKGSSKNVSLYEPEKPRRQHRKLQKIDFKEIIGKSKQQRFDFEKKNEEQRKAQLELMEYHQSTKDFLDKIREKHHLNIKNRRKYLNGNKSAEQSPFHSAEISNQTNNTEKMSILKMHLEQQRQKCNEITEEVNHLKILYHKNAATFSKIEKITMNLPFERYLRSRGDSVSEVSEEEEDEVQPLETAEEIKNRYKHLMAHTRDRKWGLLQRTEYEAQRTQSLGESRRTGDSRLTQGEDRFQQVGQTQNKMVINERLKNLLFT